MITVHGMTYAEWRDFVKDVMVRAMKHAASHGWEGIDYYSTYYIGKIHMFNKHYGILFSQEFAKAFWGEGKFEKNEDGDYDMPKNVWLDCLWESEFPNHYDANPTGEKWQHHLQQMAIHPKDPIFYIDEQLKPKVV